MDATHRIKLVKEHMPPPEAVQGALELIAILSGWSSLREMKQAVAKERAKHEHRVKHGTG